jgi:5-methyltetrahydrofolate--homocysteine methyltransferase
MNTNTETTMKKPMLLDGGTGTLLWAYAEEAGIPKTAVWTYNFDHPELVLRLHKEYLEAGAETILANMFGVNGPNVERSASTHTVSEEVAEALRLAKRTVREFGEPNRKVAADIGPLSTLLAPYGKTTKEECARIYGEIADAVFAEGADLVASETFMDLEMMRIAVTAANGSFERFRAAHPDAVKPPFLCSMTFEKRHRTMMGDTVSKIAETLTGLGADAVGMNCSYGPAEAVSIIRDFAEKTDLPLFVKPNAGMNGVVFGPAEYAAELAPAFGLVSYVGGCCGTDPAYIRELRKRIDVR